ncbi:MAG TPA: glycoside hydrolase family 36 protein [Anaerolineaceae bacterium]|nr:glycoside hydrolase family 36 protein [Anaerolineaceae bacterium]
MVEVNAAFEFAVSPEQGAWILSGNFGCIRSCLGISGSVGGRKFQSSSKVWHLKQTVADDHGLPAAIDGPNQQVTLEGRMEDEHDLQIEIRFILALEKRFLLWMVRIQNQGSAPLFLDEIEMLNAGAFPGSRIEIPGPPEEAAFFSNGWQSWSGTRTYGAGERARISRLGWLEGAMWFNPTTPRPRDRGHFGGDFFGVVGNRGSHRGLLLGFLSQKRHFGSLEARLQKELVVQMWASGDGARVDPGAVVETDWAVCAPLQLDSPDPLGVYLEAVAREHGIVAAGPAPVGWCSWYQFYTKVTAARILNNVASMKAVEPFLPLDLVQIDDGFESQVGDWFSFRETFPEGVTPLARAIREAGKTPGLWLAPFIVHPQARIVQEHPDWLLRNPRGQPVHAGFNWDAFTTALDLTHPAAMEHVCRVVSTAAHRWGFPYLKLDFLYAAALPGRRHDPTRNRAQTLRAALENIREAAGPKTTLLGCGVPLGPALGLFEAMRISTDVSGEWTPPYRHVRSFFSTEPNMPCARNALQNTITRAALHRRWWINDPDCLLVRPDCELSLAEIQTMATVMALTGGSLLLSDNLPGVPAERLHLAANLLPLIDRRAMVLDWFDSGQPHCLRLDLTGPAGDWTLIAWINWEDGPRTVFLDLGDYHLGKGAYYARSYWGRETFLVSEGKTPALDVAAHGVILLAVRKAYPNQAQYLGSDLHISQGLELAAWVREGDCQRVRWVLPRTIHGEAMFSLPRPPSSAWLDGKPVECLPVSQGVFRCEVAFDRSAEMEIWFEKR